MNIKKLNEKLENLIEAGQDSFASRSLPNGDRDDEYDEEPKKNIYRQGKTIDGKNWTEEIIDEKIINFLGQDLTYRKIYHYTEGADPENFAEKDRYTWVISKQDEDKITKIALAIRQEIKDRLGIGELGLTSAGRQISFPLQIEVSS